MVAPGVIRTPAAGSRRPETSADRIVHRWARSTRAPREAGLPLDVLDDEAVADTVCRRAWAATHRLVGGDDRGSVPARWSSREDSSKPPRRWPLRAGLGCWSARTTCGVGHQRSGDGDALLLAAEARRVMVGARLQADSAQRLHRAVAGRSRCPGYEQRQRHVVERGRPGKEVAAAGTRTRGRSGCVAAGRRCRPATSIPVAVRFTVGDVEAADDVISVLPDPTAQRSPRLTGLMTGSMPLGVDHGPPVP